MRRALSVSFALLCLLSSAAARAQPTVSVSVDRDRIAFGETVQLSVRVQTVGVQPGQSDLEAPDLRGFRLVGRYQRNSYDSLRKQNTTVLNLTLQAEATGQLTIDPFTLRSGSTVVQSDPLTITVTGNGPAAPPAGQNPATDPSGDPGADPGGDADAGALPAGFDRAVFIGWDIDDTDVWLGQQVEARLYVYVNRDLRVTNFNVGKIDLEGFWTHERGQRGRTRSQLVQVGNDTFVRDEVAHYQLFPIRTGTLTLPPVTAQMQVTRGGFARRVRRQQLERSAPPLPVTVKALPQTGRPADFRGPTVGRLDLRASVDRRRVSADEGVQLTVQTRIEGMIANTPELELPDLPDFRVFPPTTRTDVRDEGDTVVGVRTQTWLLKPKKAGRLTIPALSLPTFDPSTARYAVQRTRPLTVEVRGEPTKDAAGDGDAAGADEAADGPALRTIRQDADLSPAAAPAAGSWWFWLVLLGAPLAFGALLLNDRLQARRDADAGGRAARKAAGRARDALDAARRQTDAALAYGAVANALIAYLEARFQQPFKGLTHPQLAQALRARGVPDATVDALVSELENSDFARFAPAAAGGSVGEAATRAEAIVGQVEGAV